MDALAPKAVGAVRWVGAVLRGLLPDGVDLHIYGGAVLVAYGFWMAWPPLGPIALGALLVYIGLDTARYVRGG